MASAIYSCRFLLFGLCPISSSFIIIDWVTWQTLAGRVINIIMCFTILRHLQSLLTNMLINLCEHCHCWCFRWWCRPTWTCCLARTQCFSTPTACICTLVTSFKKSTPIILGSTPVIMYVNCILIDFWINALYTFCIPRLSALFTSCKIDKKQTVSHRFLFAIVGSFVWLCLRWRLFVCQVRARQQSTRCESLRNCDKTWLFSFMAAVVLAKDICQRNWIFH